MPSAVAIAVLFTMMLAKSTRLDISPPGSNRKYTLIGRSRAGDGTSFAIPELRWLLDCGALIQGWKPKRVFLSHTHSDHAHFLTHIKNEEHPPIIHLPEVAAPFVKRHLIAHQEMTDCQTQEESQQGGAYIVDYELRPTQAGKEISFRQGGVDYTVRTLEMTHRIPCLGFSIFQQKQKLKPEFVGRPGKEIGQLQILGVEVTTQVQEPLVCFMGDTTSQVFDSHPEILEQHNIIVVECSFIEDNDIERADITKHMHWKYLKPHIESHPDTTFVLTHFSLKYSSLWLRRFFCEQQSSGLHNIHPMLDQEEIIKQWNKKSKAAAKESDDEKRPPTCQCQRCQEGCRNG